MSIVAILLKDGWLKTGGGWLNDRATRRLRTQQEIGRMHSPILRYVEQWRGVCQSFRERRQLWWLFLCRWRKRCWRKKKEVRWTEDEANFNIAVKMRQSVERREEVLFFFLNRNKKRKEKENSRWSERGKATFVRILHILLKVYIKKTLVTCKLWFRLGLHIYV